MKIIGTVRTTENLGDHGREVEIAVTPQADETVDGFVGRALAQVCGRDWRRYEPGRAATAVVELRVDLGGVER